MKMTYRDAQIILGRELGARLRRDEDQDGVNYFIYIPPHVKFSMETPLPQDYEPTTLEEIFKLATAELDDTWHYPSYGSIPIYIDEQGGYQVDLREAEHVKFSYGRWDDTTEGQLLAQAAAKDRTAATGQSWKVSRNEYTGRLSLVLSDEEEQPTVETEMDKLLLQWLNQPAGTEEQIADRDALEVKITRLDQMRDRVEAQRGLSLYEAISLAMEYAKSPEEGLRWIHILTDPFGTGHGPVGAFSAALAEMGIANKVQTDALETVGVTPGDIGLDKEREPDPEVEPTILPEPGAPTPLDEGEDPWVERANIMQAAALAEMSPWTRPTVPEPGTPPVLDKDEALPEELLGLDLDEYQAMKAAQRKQVQTASMNPLFSVTTPGNKNANMPIAAETDRDKFSQQFTDLLAGRLFPRVFGRARQERFVERGPRVTRFG
jgi:hypothetical protein